MQELEKILEEIDNHAVEFELFGTSDDYISVGWVKEIIRKHTKNEEDILKFYYCESEDDYYIGKRVENLYYARYGKTGFEWLMSRYLPWGEHIVKPNTLWKEYTYPSEPKEIPFFEWLQGFLRKYCGGTVEECREAVEKQKPKKLCDSAEKYADGKCVGYGKSEMDDEPCEMCKRCNSYIGFEESE